jgi:hypothetical protein
MGKRKLYKLPQNTRFKLWFKIGVVIYFLLHISICHGQEIKWENLSLGVVAQVNMPNGDLGQYWGNNIAAGGKLQYKLSDIFFLEGNLLFSNYDAITKNGLQLPSITLVVINSSIKYQNKLNNWFALSLSTGLASTTFDFGEEVSDNENTSESEFGFFIATGFAFLPKSLGPIEEVELFWKLEIVLTSPEEYFTNSIGTGFLIKF